MCFTSKTFLYRFSTNLGESAPRAGIKSAADRRNVISRSLKMLWCALKRVSHRLTCGSLSTEAFPDALECLVDEAWIQMSDIGRHLSSQPRTKLFQLFSRQHFQPTVVSSTSRIERRRGLLFLINAHSCARARTVNLLFSPKRDSLLLRIFNFPIEENVINSQDTLQKIVHQMNLEIHTKCTQ